MNADEEKIKSETKNRNKLVHYEYSGFSDVCKSKICFVV